MYYYIDILIDGQVSLFGPDQPQAEVFNPNNATQAHSIFVKLKQYLFRHAKGKGMVNLDIANALGQNLANSESCPILRLL